MNNDFLLLAVSHPLLFATDDELMNNSRSWRPLEQQTKRFPTRKLFAQTPSCGFPCQPTTRTWLMSNLRNLIGTRDSQRGWPRGQRNHLSGTPRLQNEQPAVGYYVTCVGYVLYATAEVEVVCFFRFKKYEWIFKEKAITLAIIFSLCMFCSYIQK